MNTKDLAQLALAVHRGICCFRDDADFVSMIGTKSSRRADQLVLYGHGKLPCSILGDAA